MPVSEKLLEILACPVTKVRVKPLSQQQVLKLNDQISHSLVKYVDGSLVEDPLEEGLITIDGKTIYRVADSIPVMLTEMGIPTDQISGL